MGDFKAGTKPSERKGLAAQPSRVEIQEFRNFIVHLELEDIPLIGRKFTWYKAEDTAMSRLDRFLLSKGWVISRGVTSQWALKRDVSDHCPLVLKIGKQDWGPEPFRFINCWVKHPTFEKLVLDSWSEANVTGWEAFVMMEKREILKSAVRGWNVSVFGSSEVRIGSLESSICELDEKAECTGLSDS